MKSIAGGSRAKDRQPHVMKNKVDTVDAFARRRLEPELLADELFLLLEGVRVAAQSMGHAGLGDRLIRMDEAMIAAHQK